jgi:hypothetical protein
MSVRVSRMRREDPLGANRFHQPPHDEDLARPTGIAAIPYAVYKGVGVVKRHGKNQNPHASDS